MGRMPDSTVTVPLRGVKDVLGLPGHPGLDFEGRINPTIDIIRFLEPRGLEDGFFALGGTSAVTIDRNSFRIFTRYANTVARNVNLFTVPAHFVGCIRWISIDTQLIAGAPTGASNIYIETGPSGAFQVTIPGGFQAQLVPPWHIFTRHTAWLQEGQGFRINDDPLAAADTIDYYITGQILLYPAGLVPAFCT